MKPQGLLVSTIDLFTSLFNMKTTIDTYLQKKAAVLMLMDKDSNYLKKDEIELLNKIAPTLILRVKENVEGKKDPLDDLSDDDKVILLAFVVYKRQNVTTTNKDIPNEEDAATILRGNVYSLKNGKKIDKKRLDKDLLEQLAKAGMPLTIK